MKLISNFFKKLERFSKYQSLAFGAFVNSSKN